MGAYIRNSKKYGGGVGLGVGDGVYYGVVSDFEVNRDATILE